jgi:hypothetical protein
LKSSDDWQVVEFGLETTYSKIFKTPHVIGRTEPGKGEENPLSHGRRLEPLINPKILDEVRKRRNRLVHSKQHSHWMPKTALRNRGPVDV